MVMKNKKLAFQAFCPYSIFNNCLQICQEQANKSACSLDGFFYAESLPSYMMANSPYTCPQSRIVAVHRFVASKVARYKAFKRAISLGNTLLWRLSLR